MKKTFNWALAGTGNIVKKFLTGLKYCEGIGSISVVSRDREKAASFAAQYGLDHSFGSYQEMLADSSVDIVYIGTPHSTHRDYAVMALEAGKAVLCEKPVCMNAGEMEEIMAASSWHNAFFMEAMWTRFLPAIVKVRQWLRDGMIGDVTMMEANFGFVVPWVPEGRLLNPNLGGGALLDAGVYPLSLASMVFGGQAPEKVLGLLSFGETKVDEQFSGLISYGNNRTASVAAAIRTRMVNDAWIYGTLGKIHIPDFVFGRSAVLVSEGKFTEQFSPEFLSNGYNYEALEVMKRVAEGKRESPVMPQGESLLITRIMDIIRKEFDFVYPFERPRSPA